MKVSSSTPRATITPTWVSTMSGRTPSTTKTEASTMPAEVMTPPVRATARTIASRVAWVAASSRARMVRKIE